jgi:hypothetical protein
LESIPTISAFNPFEKPFLIVYYKKMNIADKQAVIKAVFLLTVFYEMEPTSDEKRILQGYF